MKISIIIPIYNNLPLTINCLESIAQFSYYFKESEVIIIDDHSEDGSSEYFAKFAAENNWLIYYRNVSNLKFARSCNAGANLAKGEFLIFLNNDTVVTENWDKFLLDTIEMDKDTWMVGGKCLYPDMTIQHAGVYLPELNRNSFGHVYSGFPSYFPPANFEKELRCVTAACMIMRRADFQQLGGFDTSFLNGLEDVDLCMKITGNGKKIRYQPKCEIIHYESKSEGRFDHSRQNADLLFNRWKGRIRSDYNEMINQDLRICTDHDLMSAVSHFGSEKDMAVLLEVNKNLKLNERGNLELSISKEPGSIHIPFKANKVEDELLLKLECNSSEKTFVKLQYKTKSGYEDTNLFKSKQIINQGNNLILFNLSTAYLSDLPELVFPGKKSQIEIISFSLYTYKKNLPAKKPSVSILFHSRNETDYIKEFIHDLNKSGFKLEIELKPISDTLTTASLNFTIASSEADYILILEEGVRVMPDFLIHAIEIMEFQANIGFVYSDTALNEGETTTLYEHGFFPGNLLIKGNTDMAGIFRKTCWEKLKGYDESLKCFRNLDLFFGIMASGNWLGYKMKYPAFSVHDLKIKEDFDFTSEKDRLSIKYLKYILKVCGKIITRERNSENKTNVRIHTLKQQDDLSLHSGLFIRLHHFLIRLLRIKK